MELNQVTDARSPGYTPGVRRLPNIKALTSVRFFAAFYVALYHLVRPFALWGPLAGAMSGGYVGVSFFFVLSGFILTYSHALEYEQGRKNAPKFWMARFARVYPVFLVSMLFATYAGRAQFAQKIHILAYIADLLLVQSWSIRMVNFFNIPAWSLSCEAFFYLVFPFVLLPLRPSSAKKSLLAMAAFWFLALLFPLLCLKLYPAAAWSEDATSIPGSDFAFWIRRVPLLALPEFLAGMSLGWFYLRFRPRAWVASVLAATGVIGLAVCFYWANHIPIVLLHNGVLFPLFAMLILGLCEENWLSRLLSNSFLVLLGEASFALYLIHFLFNDWTKSLGASESIPSAVWKLAILIPLSVVLHLFVERPCRKVILGWWSRRHPTELKVAVS